MRVVFLGTPDFAVPSLERLASSGVEIVAVISQPDRMLDRKGKVIKTPVHEVADKYGFKFFPFEKISRPENIEILSKLNADLFITAAYGQILSKRVLEIPRFGTFNVHGSLLPKYRGAAPVQWSIINGDKTTGITIMRTDAGIDTGDMILKREIEILPDETGGQLMKRLADLGAECIIKAIHKLVDGTITYTKQDESQFIYSPMIKKSDGEINFSQSANQIKDKIRALNPWPSCYCFFNDMLIKIHKASVVENDSINTEIGKIILSDSKKGLHVLCGKGILSIEEIQVAGSKKMNINDFLKGRNLPVGEILTKTL